jgi:lipoate-protein ligase A
MSSRAVQSVRARVGNIRPSLAHDMDVAGFIDGFRDFLLQNGRVHEQRNYTDTEISGIEALADTRYRQWNWVYGESPDFICTKK